MLLSIPRAEYQGTWGDFAYENAAFIPDHELDRIGRALARGESVTHVAHSAGEFTFFPGNVLDEVAGAAIPEEERIRGQNDRALGEDARTKEEKWTGLKDLQRSRKWRC